MPHDYARSFAPGLTNPLYPAPPGLVAGAGKGTRKRYDVYRNNVTVSLVDALAAIYPAVQRIAGVDLFRAMARRHVRATPPGSPLLFEYGRDFPAFIASCEYAQDMPWLPDTARLERAWLDAYHAADDAVLAPDALHAVPAAALAGVCLRAHPAARIVRSPYPAVTILAMNRAQEAVTPLLADKAEDGLVTRPGQEVIVARLPPGGAAFLGALLAGAPLGAAATAAFDEASGFDLGLNLGAMIAAGVFTSLHLENPP